MKKQIIYVDMDGVLCNFEKAAKEDLIKTPKQNYPQSQWGFFLKLEEIKDAIKSFKILQEKYDVWILTKPSCYNLNSYSEKAHWVLQKLGFKVLEKTIMCCDKSLLKGDYLIDDTNLAGQSDFEGRWLNFGSERFPDWNSIVKYLMK